ncbi:MAG: hypothetical protein IJX87_01230 [Clostridia bacterium]|nr:hypothetical protein [Clostridia bacterium]
MKDDLHFLQLWDLYSPMLTATQREITDLYFNYDLSLGEIAEQKGVSRQSVSDCLHKCRKQLENYENKLGFSKALVDLSREYSAYMTEVGRWLLIQRETHPELQEEWDGLQNKLNGVHREFGAELTETDDGVIVGKTFRQTDERNATDEQTDAETR